jgi:hypothetical protein
MRKTFSQTLFSVATYVEWLKEINSEERAAWYSFGIGRVITSRDLFLLRRCRRDEQRSFPNFNSDDEAYSGPARTR